MSFETDNRDFVISGHISTSFNKMLPNVVGRGTEPMCLWAESLHYPQSPSMILHMEEKTVDAEDHLSHDVLHPYQCTSSDQMTLQLQTTALWQEHASSLQHCRTDQNA